MSGTIPELTPASEREIIAAFGRWWDAAPGFGRTRNPGHERYDHTPCLRRFIEGWRDAEAFASDFKRRGMPWENGERSTYMTARFLGACAVQDARRAIDKASA